MPDRRPLPSCPACGVPSFSPEKQRIDQLIPWLLHEDGDLREIPFSKVVDAKRRGSRMDWPDFAVGLSGIKKIGARVEKGEPLLTVHAHTDQALRLVQPLLEKAVEIT